LSVGGVRERKEIVSCKLRSGMAINLKC
jgi:hypothetical protein